MTTNNAAIASSSPFCPACGHNLQAEQPLELGGLQLDPRGDALWHGRKIPLTSSQFLVFATIAQARGKLVSYDVLAERAGYDGRGDAHNCVQVLAHRARRALRAANCPPTIVRPERGRGYRLDVELLLELAQESARKC